jgi:hypothetical protein
MNRSWMRAGRVALLAIAVGGAPLSAQQTSAPAGAPAATAARPSDVASPEALLAAVYEIISGPASQQRDWDRFRSLHLPTARFVFVLSNPQGQQQLFNWSVDEFIQNAGPDFQTGAGFWEREIGRRVDRFGRAAQVFSAYESGQTGPNGPFTERGVNSVQVVHYQDRWWVANVVFDFESRGNPIPPEYLGTRNP